jgi:hypothetical protein
MNPRTLLLSFGCIAAALNSTAQDKVFSGPQPGERTTPFKVVTLAGADAGKERDLVADYKGAPTVLVFVHGIERSMTPLLSVVDQYAFEKKDSLRAAFVFLNGDRVNAEQRIPAVAQSLRLKAPATLSLDGAEGPGNYGLNKQCLLTLVIAKDNKVTANFALVQPGIADAPAVLKALGAVIGDSNPPEAEALRERRMAELGAGKGRPAADPRAKQPEMRPTSPNLLTSQPVVPPRPQEASPITNATVTPKQGGVDVDSMHKRGAANSWKTLSPGEVYLKAKESVVVMTCYDSTGNPSTHGTGFYFHTNRIASNYHVVDGASRITFRVVGATNEHPVKRIVASSRSLDLAVLEVEELGRPLRVSRVESVNIGDRVYTIGNPRGLEGTFSGGMVSGLRDSGDFTVIQVTTPISHGSSGGPLLTTNAEVVGVMTRSLSGSQNLNFAVLASPVLTLRDGEKDWTPSVKRMIPPQPKRDASKGELPGAAPTDPRLLGLLRSFIQPTNDDARVDSVLKEVEEYIKGNADLTKQTVDGWVRVLHLKYGTDYARAQGQKMVDRLKK